MKNTLLMLSASSALSGLASAAVSSPPTFSPPSFPLKTIGEGSEEFGRIQEDFTATLMREGILAVNNIPFYPELREAVFSSATKCMMSRGSAARIVHLEDGTERTTLASPFDFASGSSPFHAGDSVPCKEFESVSTKFRQVVDSVSLAFASRLSAIVGGKARLPEPLLKSTGSVHYDTVLDIVQHGQHLDHFHSYRGPLVKGEEEATIGFHTDQGLFIAISPALMVNAEGDAIQAPEGAFLIKRSTGESVQVAFDPESLVFMLGDGVEQYVNTKGPSASFRSVPHALIMPASQIGVYRNWFGRMFLPPNNAINEDSGLTYGRMREFLAGAENRNDIKSSIGCSASNQIVTSRKLSELVCDSATSIYCWHRCMPYTATASPAACAKKETGFNCTSDFNDHIYQAKIGHGQFNPRCTDSTTLFEFSDFAPDLPKVAQDSCASFSVASLVSKGNYTHKLDLNEGATLVWKVVGSEVAVELVRTGARLGYIGFGINNPGGDAGGMLGGVAVLGIAKYDGANVNGQTLSVEEYRISNSSTAFKDWNTPLTKTIKKEGLTLLGCGGSMKFQGSGIGGKSFNLNGVNKLMYAMDTAHGKGVMKTFEGKDWLMYHSERKKFDLDFKDKRYDINNPVVVDDSDDSKSGVSAMAPSAVMGLIVSGAVALLALL